jgi:hypothetical protein
LFTHNSDESIDDRFLQYLTSPRLIAWFAQNAAIAHPKLIPIPIGVANAGYAHGDTVILDRIRAERRRKTHLFYANYSILTNPTERVYCLKHTNIPLVEGVDGERAAFAGGYNVPATFERYLRDLRDSYFCISPNGHGLDCHRTWEALYMETIPIVTASQVAIAHRTFPIVILQDWSEFAATHFSPDVYHSMWNMFDPTQLNIDAYMVRVRARIGECVSTYD